MNRSNDKISDGGIDDGDVKMQQEHVLSKTKMMHSLFRGPNTWVPR